MSQPIKYPGLTEEEVLASRARYGANQLSPVPKPSVWRLYLQKFRDPMILILLVALVLSFGIAFYNYGWQGEGGAAFLEPVGILMAIILSTGIAFYFEQRADREFNLLNLVNDETLYKVMRDGRLQQVAKRDIVVGDTILIETGEEIPADGELLEAVSLQVNESSLTGEPVAAKWADAAQLDPHATYPSNWVYRGTSVTDGHATMVVRSVGDATESGKVFQGIQMANDVETPLNAQLGRLASLLLLSRAEQWTHPP